MKIKPKQTFARLVFKCFPFTNTMYNWIFPSKGIRCNKLVKNIVQIKTKYSLTDFISSGADVFFKSKYGAYMKYVESWGAYGSEFGVMHEERELETILQILPENAVVFDIGANYGSFCLNISSKRRDIKFKAFEPILSTFNCFMKNVKFNGFENRIDAINAAVGDENGFVRMTQDFHTNNTVVNSESKAGAIKIDEVKSLRLDTYIKSNNIKRVDLLKLDVEGYEWFVLKGAMDLISKYKPYIFIEIADENLEPFGLNTDKIISFIESIGYVNMKVQGFITTNYMFKHISN